MAKYRKKPVVIEAEIYRLGMEDGFIWHGDYGAEPVSNQDYNETDFAGYAKGKPFIYTLEGFHEISDGDYIVTGVKGERYPCKPDIFEMTYEKEAQGVV